MKTEVLITPLTNVVGSFGDTEPEKLIAKYGCNFFIYQKEAIASHRRVTMILAEMNNQPVDESVIQYLESVSKIVKKELDHCYKFPMLRKGDDSARQPQ